MVGQWKEESFRAVDLLPARFVVSRSQPLRGCSLLTPCGQPKSLTAPSAPIYEMASRNKIKRRRNDQRLGSVTRPRKRMLPEWMSRIRNTKGWSGRETGVETGLVVDMGLA